MPLQVDLLLGTDAAARNAEAQIAGVTDKTLFLSLLESHTTQPAPKPQEAVVAPRRDREEPPHDADRAPEAPRKAEGEPRPRSRIASRAPAERPATTRESKRASTDAHTEDAKVSADADATPAAPKERAKVEGDAKADGELQGDDVAKAANAPLTGTPQLATSVAVPLVATPIVTAQLAAPIVTLQSTPPVPAQTGTDARVELAPTLGTATGPAMVQTAAKAQIVPDGVASMLSRAEADVATALAKVSVGKVPTAAPKTQLAGELVGRDQPNVDEATAARVDAAITKAWWTEGAAKPQTQAQQPAARVGVESFDRALGVPWDRPEAPTKDAQEAPVAGVRTEERAPTLPREGGAQQDKGGGNLPRNPQQSAGPPTLDATQAAPVANDGKAAVRVVSGGKGPETAVAEVSGTTTVKPMTAAEPVATPRARETVTVQQAQAPETPQRTDRANPTQMAERIAKLVAEQGQGGAELHLDAEGGRVNVRVDVQGNAVAVRFTAETQALEGQLRERMQELREHLRSAGFEMKDATFGSATGGFATRSGDSGSQGDGSNGGESQGDPRGGNARREPAAEATATRESVRKAQHDGRLHTVA